MTGTVEHDLRHRALAVGAFRAGLVIDRGGEAIERIAEAGLLALREGEGRGGGPGRGRGEDHVAARRRHRNGGAPIDELGACPHARQIGVPPLGLTDAGGEQDEREEEKGASEHGPDG